MLHGIVQQVDGTKSGNIKQLGPFLFGNPGIICRVSFIPETSTDIGSKQDAFQDWQKIQNFLHRSIRALTNRLRRPTPTHRHRNGASRIILKIDKLLPLGGIQELGHILGKLHFGKISKTGPGGGNRARISGSQSIDSSSVRGACSKWASSSA